MNLFQFLLVPFLLLPAEDAFDKAAKQLSEALSGKDMAKKTQAIEAVVKLGDARGFSLLAREFGFMYNLTAEHERKERDASDEVARKKKQIETKSKQAKTDDDKISLEKDRTSLELYTRENLDKLRQNLKEEVPLRQALRDGVLQLYKALPAARRPKEAEALRKMAFEDQTMSNRAPAMELYSVLGDPGAAPQFLKSLKDSLKERVKIQSSAAQRKSNFEKLTKQIQKAVEDSKGQIPASLANDYKKAQSELTRINDQIDASIRIAVASKRSLALAVLSLEGEARQKAVEAVAAEAAKGEPGTRYSVIEVLGSIDDPNARAALRSILTTDQDPGARVFAIQSLAQLRDDESLTPILDKFLKDEVWEVRAAAIRALATIRSKDAVPRLIAAMESESGRLQDDCDEVLQNLTGKDFHGNVGSWKSWWKSNESGFQLAEATPLKSKSAHSGDPGEGQTGVSFYGIKTKSQRILFVLDISGSMNYGVGKKDGDYPNKDEKSRIDVAKDELIRAIGAIPEGGSFNIIVFATEVRTWQDKMVQANEANRTKAKTYVNGLEANGGTNFYGALSKALEIVGIVSDHFSSALADTVYFLSDGKPTDGEMTDPEKILQFVRERNRLSKMIIHTVGISSEADLALMQKLAEENGGNFVSR